VKATNALHDFLPAVDPDLISISRKTKGADSHIAKLHCNFADSFKEYDVYGMLTWGTHYTGWLKHQQAWRFWRREQGGQTKTLSLMVATAREGLFWAPENPAPSCGDAEHENSKTT
jgi:hypothetical protein